MSNIIKVPFQNDYVPIIPVDGKPQVVLKPALESIGLDPWAQIEKLKKRSWARTAAAAVRGSDGRPRDTTVCDVRTFLMLLATIDENLVSAHVRPKLIAYQAEVADVIESYWTNVSSRSTREYSPLYKESMKAINASGEFPGKVIARIYMDQGIYEFLKMGLNKGPRWHRNYLDESGRPVYLYQRMNELELDQNKFLQGKIVAAYELIGHDPKALQAYFATLNVTKMISAR